MKLLTVIVVLIMLTGCDRKPRKYTFVKTERGLIRFGIGYCNLGMLLNDEMINILDENSKPITCSGYIKLTQKEFDNYDK